MQHSKGQLHHLEYETVGVAGGDEVYYGADRCFARLDDWWVDVGRVESLEEGGVPE